MRSLTVALVLLLAPALASAQPATLQGITEAEWQSQEDNIILYVTPDADSAWVSDTSDSTNGAWWASLDNGETWVYCTDAMYPPQQPFNLAQLADSARATLRGRADPGINGPLNNMEECTTALGSFFNQ